MAKNVETVAANHRVILFANPAPGESGEYDDEHDPEHEVGRLLVRCPDCGSVWPPQTSQKGEPMGLWFLCPNLCNLTERVANRLLREMGDGTRPVDAEMAERCRSYLSRLTRPKRAATAENVDADPLQFLSDDIRRRMEWHARHSVWTDELRQAYDDFD